MTSALLLQPAEITALYLRLSDDDAGDALAVARQRKDMTGYAERLGLPVVEFCDNSFSASRYARRKRPAYSEMVKLIEAGEVRHVVIWDLSRLTRQPKELEHLIDLADAGTVEVHTMTGKLDIRDSDGRAWARTICTMNAKASDDTSKRIKRQQEQARAAGRYHGGGRPFGFETSGAMVRDDEAELIKEAARRILAGEGLLTIANDWNRRELAAPLGGIFRPKTIKDALVRPLTVTAGILTADQQEELRAVLLDPTRRRQASTARTHLLSGLLSCGHCGARMRSKPRNDGKAGYACDGCKRISRLAAPVEEFVTAAVLDALSKGLPGAVEAVEEDEGVRELVERIDGLSSRLAALEADYVDGGTDLPTFKRMKAGFEEKMTEARRALARRSERRALVEVPAGADVSGWWDVASIDQRRAVITAVTERITILPAGRGQRSFDSSKVDIIWRG